MVKKYHAVSSPCLFWLLSQVRTLGEKCPYSEFSGPHFLSECGKMRTRITPNADTFHAVATSHSLPISGKCSNFVPTEGCNVTKKETPAQTFSYELYEILRRIFFCRKSSKQLLLKSLWYHKEWLFS